MKETKLGDFLRTLEPRRPVKIGCTDGSSFVFAGRAEDFLESPEGMLIYGNQGGRHGAPRSRHPYKNVPYLDRYVQSAFATLQAWDKGTVVIMIDGNENGSLDSVNGLTELSGEKIPDDNVYSILGAVVRPMCKALVDAFYEHEKNLDDDGSIISWSKEQKTRKAITMHTRRLMEYGWDIAGDGFVGQVKDCQRQAIRKLRKERYGKNY